MKEMKRLRSRGGALEEAESTSPRYARGKEVRRRVTPGTGS
jgi:hypothetical protein